MSKRIFYKGKLVRKRTNSGLVVGPWLQVETANAHYVYAKTIKGGKDLILLQRKNVYSPRMARLQISEERVTAIVRGRLPIITHLATPLWQKALEDDIEVVMFYSQDGIQKVYCSVDEISIRYYSSRGFEKYIKITIREVLLCI